jgi:hypothetical protein
MAEVGVLLAQTAFGEEAIGPGLENLRSILKSPAAIRMIDSQIRDEERHAKTYRDLAESFLPGVTSRTPLVYQKMQSLFQKSADPTWLLAAMHLCLESFAVGAFNYRKLAIESDALDQVDRRTLVDEMRHVSFGPLILEVLGKSGLRVSKKEAIESTRTMHNIFLEDDIVGQVRDALGLKSTLCPIDTGFGVGGETDASFLSVDLYRRECVSAYKESLSSFFGTLRGHSVS